MSRPRLFASTFTPKTSAGLFFRNQVTRLLAIDWIADRLIGRELRDDIELPLYDM